MSSRALAAFKTVVVLLACAASSGAVVPAGRSACAPPPHAPSAVAGRVLILPGVGNTRFHLARFVAATQTQLPHFEVEVRTWGKPFLTIHNLRAHERNVATAQATAQEIAAWRRANPATPFYLVGYSGGGGMATLVTAALPSDVGIDRLILVAPAISPDYPLVDDVLPRVHEFVVNFASERDLQVGWGTKTFGTIDRRYTASAGAVGFSTSDARLLQYHWSRADEPFGHAGNHLAYLNPRWQAAKLLPSLDPALGRDALVEQWAQSCEES
jgi:pimeloyl-ACP methyl ester carboxylesterase